MRNVTNTPARLLFGRKCCVNLVLTQLQSGETGSLLQSTHSSIVKSTVCCELRMTLQQHQCDTLWGPQQSPSPWLPGKQVSVWKAQAVLEEAQQKRLCCPFPLPLTGLQGPLVVRNTVASFAHFFFTKQNGTVTAYQMLVGSAYKS